MCSLFNSAFLCWKPWAKYLCKTARHYFKWVGVELISLHTHLISIQPVIVAWRANYFTIKG